jgi:hypothetical protein
VAEVVEERVERLAQKAEFVIRELDDVHGRETNATPRTSTPGPAMARSAAAR